MKNKIKILALCGKSASGKDAIQQHLIQDEKFASIISTTTRPPRDNEIDGVHYHFISEEAFLSKELRTEMLETTAFRGWYYGTARDSLDANKINVGVFNPEGISNLIRNEDLDVMVVKIECPDKIRLMRSLKRENNPDCAEICRRYFADEQDFKRISFPFHLYDNDGRYSIQEISEIIKVDAEKFFGQNQLSQIVEN